MISQKGGGPRTRRRHTCLLLLLVAAVGLLFCWWASWAARLLGKFGTSSVLRFTEVQNRKYLGNFGTWEVGTEPGTELFGFGKFGSVLGKFSSVLGFRFFVPRAISKYNNKNQVSELLNSQILLPWSSQYIPDNIAMFGLGKWYTQITDIYALMQCHLQGDWALFFFLVSVSMKDHRHSEGICWEMNLTRIIFRVFFLNKKLRAYPWI